MSDPNFFSTTKKGEIAELKDELNDLDRQKRKEAVSFRRVFIYFVLFLFEK